jgi:hypothetical protein
MINLYVIIDLNPDINLEYYNFIRSIKINQILNYFMYLVIYRLFFSEKIYSQKNFNHWIEAN